MRKGSIYIAVILALGFIFSLTTPASAVLITYDGTGNDYPTQIGSYYSSLEGNPVHSDGFMWLDYDGDVSGTYGPHSTPAMAFSVNTNPVWVEWSADVTNVSFWYGRYYSTGLSVMGFNDGVEVFDSHVLTANAGGMFQYTAPDVSIDKLVFYGKPNYWTMDDLSYELVGNNTYPIPEPATLSLFGLSFLGLLGARRKKG